MLPQGDRLRDGAAGVPIKMLGFFQKSKFAVSNFPLLWYA